MKTDMESAAADHVAALTGVLTAQEFQALEEELKRTHEEVSHLGAELVAERSLRVAEQASR
jgi:cell division protein ZapA (FtsZ GTPase activity inhibitor)